MKRFVRRAVAALALAVASVAVTGVAPAQAGGWTTIADGPGGSVLLACKTAESGGYGPVWKITLVLANDHIPNSTVGGATIDVRRGTSVVSRTELRTWQQGQWDVKTTYASRWYPDYLHVVSAGWGNGLGNGAGDGNYSVSMNSIRSC